MPQTSETAMVNAATRRSSPGVTTLGNVTGLCVISRPIVACASSRPPAAPSSVSTQLSVTSCCSSRAAAGADGHAQRDLPAPHFGSGDEQVRDVGAGDDQHERDRRHQQPQRQPQPSEQLGRQRAHLDAARLVRRPDTRVPSREAIVSSSALRRGQRHARLETPQHRESSAAAIGHRLPAARTARTESTAAPSSVDADEARRHHAEHRERLDRSTSPDGRGSAGRRRTGAATDRRSGRSTIDGFATSSSSARNVRPSAGVTPSSEKYDAETNSVSMRSGSSAPASVISCESNAARSSKSVSPARASRGSRDRTRRGARRRPRRTLPMRYTSRSGSCVGNRLRARGVDDAEDGGVAADADRQREHAPRRQSPAIGAGCGRHASRRSGCCRTTHQSSCVRA